MLTFPSFPPINRKATKQANRGVHAGQMLSFSPLVGRREDWIGGMRARHEFVIIGGGLAGIVAAVRLAQMNGSVLLLDRSLPEAQGKLGGFAKFSGAKFSLPPAGLGLLGVAGSFQRLETAFYEVLNLLGLSGYERAESLDIAASPPALNAALKEVNLRRYQSILLTPNEIDELLMRLEHMLPSRVQHLQAYCEGLRRCEEGWQLTIRDRSGNLSTVVTQKVLYAGGRAGNQLLTRAGVRQVSRKGLDLGARIEFAEPSSLERIQTHGPDAKFLFGNCRTFCLNFPGAIYRYNFGALRIPGGVVTDGKSLSSNVGLLCRVREKEQHLAHLRALTEPNLLNRIHTPHVAEDSVFGEAEELLRWMYGNETADQLVEFGMELWNAGLIDFRAPHLVHLPLIDWHWPTFAVEDHSFETSESGLYALGDSSGHARGLLQAAVTGWLAVEEISHV